MTRNRIENESLIGVSLNDLQEAEAKIQHRDGTTERVAVDETSAWPEAEPRPDSWNPETHKAITERKRGGLSRRERVDQSVRVEAAALKALSTVKGTDPQKHAQAVAAEMLRALGGEFTEYAEQLAP